VRRFFQREWNSKCGDGFFSSPEVPISNTGEKLPPETAATTFIALSLAKVGAQIVRPKAAAKRAEIMRSTTLGYCEYIALFRNLLLSCYLCFSCFNDFG
jgi:hypothetical protein